MDKVADLFARMKERLLRATLVVNCWESNGRRRAVLIVRGDMFANSVKPRVLTHTSGIWGSMFEAWNRPLGRSGESGILRWLPALNAMSLALYTRDGLQALGRASLRLYNCRVTRYLNGMSVLWTMLAVENSSLKLSGMISAMF